MSLKDVIHSKTFTPEGQVSLNDQLVNCFSSYDIFDNPRVCKDLREEGGVATTPATVWY